MRDFGEYGSGLGPPLTLACGTWQHVLTSDRMGRYDWGACLACMLGTIGIGLTTVQGSGRDELVVAVGILLALFFVLTGWRLLFCCSCAPWLRRRETVSWLCLGVLQSRP